MSRFEKWFLFLVFLFLVLYGVLGYFKTNIQLSTYTMQTEQHVDNLYGIYQSNMSACLSKAEEDKKTAEEINTTCIKELNNSIVAQWLASYGYSELLQKNLPVE